MGKLTDNDVIRIKNLVEDGILTKSKIARMFNVSRKTIYDVIGRGDN